MKNSRKFVSAGLMYLVLIIIFIVAMFPVLYTILGSFKGNMELLASNGKLLPEKFVFDNYKQAWELGNFAKYTGNSIFMAGTIVFGTIFTSTVAGYCFERGDFQGKNILFALVVSSMFVNLGSLTLYPQFAIAKFLGINKSLWGVIIIRVLGLNVTNLFITCSYIRSISKEIDDRHSWNDYLMPMVFTLSNPDRMPLIVGIMNLKGSGEAASSWNLMLAGSAIAMVPMIIVYLCFNRYFIEGLTAGAVKG